MKFNFDSPEQEVRIELLPLIDVIFCILTFFILGAVTLTRQSALNVDLPRAANGTTQMRKILLVGVDFGPTYYLEKQAVSPEQFSRALSQFLKTNPDGKVVLSASRNASYGDVAEVLDWLKSVGGDRVGLATQTISDGNAQLPGLLPNVNGQTDPLAPLGSPKPSSAPNSFQLDPLSSPQLPSPITPNSGGSTFPNLGTPNAPASGSKSKPN